MPAAASQDRPRVPASPERSPRGRFPPPSTAAATASSTRRPTSTGSLRTDATAASATIRSIPRDAARASSTSGRFAVTSLEPAGTSRRWRRSQRPGFAPGGRGPRVVATASRSCGTTRRSSRAPIRRVAQAGVVLPAYALDAVTRSSSSRHSCGDERISPKPAGLVSRNEETIEVGDQRVPVTLEPVPQRNRGPRSLVGVDGMVTPFSIPRFHGQTSWQMSQP